MNISLSSQRLRTAASSCSMQGDFDKQRSLSIGNALKRYFADPSQNSQALIQVLQNQNIVAVCFDMDGTLVDTETANWRVITEGCVNQDIMGNILINDLTDADKKNYEGKTIVGFLTELFTQRGVENPEQKAKAISDTKFDVFTHLLDSREIEKFNKVIELVKLLKRHKFELALVTNGQANTAERLVEYCGLQNHFTSFKSRDDCNEDKQKHKPSPFLYEEALKQLRVKPSKALAFEDSNPGLQSAYDAGCHVVAIKNTKEQSTKLRNSKIIPVDISA